MLSLALLRHAKSSWDNPALDDFDRPLNERGRLAAPLMGRVLGELGFKPDLILCSPSQRTRETLELARGHFACSKAQLLFEEELYLSSSDSMLERLRAIAAGPVSVLMIGHNPGMHGLALKLAGTGDAKALGRLEDKFPTGALALFTFEPSNWRDLKPATGRLEQFIAPRDRS